MVAMGWRLSSHRIVVESVTELAEHATAGVLRLLDQEAESIGNGLFGYGDVPVFASLLRP